MRVVLGRAKTGRKQQQAANQQTGGFADGQPAEPDPELETYLAALAPEESVETTGTGRRFGGSQVYQLRLPLMANEKLKEIAARRGTSPAALAREWVLHHLEQQAPEEGQQQPSRLPQNPGLPSGGPQNPSQPNPAQPNPPQQSPVQQSPGETDPAEQTAIHQSPAAAHPAQQGAPQNPMHLGMQQPESQPAWPQGEWPGQASAQRLGGPLGPGGAGGQQPPPAQHGGPRNPGAPDAGAQTPTEAEITIPRGPAYYG